MALEVRHTFTSPVGDEGDPEKVGPDEWNGVGAHTVEGVATVAQGGTGAATAADARTNLGVAVGSDVQAFDAGLADIAGLAVTDGNFIVGNGTNWVAESGATARTSLGLGALATGADAGDVPFTPAGGIAATDVQAALAELDGEKQPLDADLTAIAGLTPVNDDFLQRKAGAWTNRTVAQVLTDLAAPGTTFQPLDADLTAIAALTTTTAGRSALTITDPNADRVMVWDDSAGAVSPIALADIATEAAPAAGDFLLIYGAEGDLRRVDWSGLPGGAPADATYVALTTNGSLTNERVLTAGLGIAVVDAGAGSTVTVSFGNAGTALTDPNADRIPFWDDSAGGVAWLAPGSHLSISGTTLDVVTPTSGTSQATTSGSAWDFTGLPAGLSRIVIMFNGVSLSGTDDFLVQIGDSGGVATTAYVSSSATLTNAAAVAVVSNATGFIIDRTTAGVVFSGHMTLTHVGSNTWVASHAGKQATTICAFGGGDKTLSATLDRVRITVTGSDTGDAGSVNILYE